jgi:PAS domain S-box-containing protein
MNRIPSRTVIAVATVFGAVVIGLAVLLGSMRTDALKGAERDGANLAWMLEARLDATLRRIDVDLDELARQIAAAQQLGGAPQLATVPMRAILEQKARSFDEISGIYRFDAQGELLAASRDVPRFNVADRGHFRQVRDNPDAGLVFGDAQIARSTGAFSMVAARGIRDGQGRFLGMVAAVIDLEYFLRLLASIDLGPNGAIAIRRSDDSRLVLRRPLVQEQINKAANYAIRDRVMGGEAAGVEYLTSPTDGLPRISTFRALPHYPFYVVVASSQADVLRDWQRLALLISGATVAILTMLAWLIWRLKRGEVHALGLASQLKESEERLRYALAATGDGVWDWDIPSNHVRHNDQWQRMLGLSEAPAVHPVEFFAEKIHPDDRAAVTARLEAALAGGSDYASEHRMRAADGSYLWVLDRGQVVERTAEGKPLRMVGSMSDITARRQAEEQRRESDMLLRSSIDAIDEAFVIFDPEDRLIYCNEKYRQVYPSIADIIQPGVRFEDVVRTWKQRLPMDLDGEGIEAWVKRRLEAHRTGQVMIQHTDNDHWVRIVERRAPTGHVVGFRVDVTELYRAKEEAVAANIAKSRFLATMSHEIRTPMNGILGMTQLLLQDEVSQEERLEYARTIHSSGLLLLDLLNDILDLSRVEAGKLRLELGTLDAGAVAGEVRSLFAEVASAKGLPLNVTVSLPAAHRYRGDAHRVRQMLSNLVGNAIKFTERGTIGIEVCEVATGETADVVQLEFAVRDTGIGVREDIQARLFQPFSQADSSTTREFGGSGLGLSIVRSLAELMGGTVGVESEQGQGARFWFRIPVARLAAHGHGDESGPDGTEERGGLRGRVLMVEDNRTNRIVIKKLLEKLGLEVLDAENGADGVALIQGGAAVDLVLMDMQMPVLDGESATRQIRAWEGSTGRERVPIIALTANAYESDRQNCVAAGMDDFVTKPVMVDELRAALRRWLPYGPK